MPTLPTQGFTTIVANTIAGIQGRASKLINFSTGSTLRAIVEGFAGLFLWFQAMALQVLAATRLSTSSGTDVDTFTADFMPLVVGTSSPRLGAQFATGTVVYSRFTASSAVCFVPVGSTCKTSDGSQSYAVTSNATYSTYSAGPPAGYTLAANLPSVTVPVTALVSGAAGNIVAGAISISTSPITGVDTVTNPAAFLNGSDVELDSALKVRFANYILGLSRGDIFGLNSSISGTAVTVQWALTEGYNLDGSYHPGFFFVVADDGSGAPTPAFLAIVLAAAQAVRPLGIQCAVFPAVVISATVSLQITTAVGYDHNVVVGLVSNAIKNNINSLGVGVPLPWSIISSWAYAIPGVTFVSNVLLNNGSGDNASIYPSKLSQDGTYKILYATIKTNKVIVS